MKWPFRKEKTVSTNNTHKMSMLDFGPAQPVLTTMSDYTDVQYDNDNDYYTLPVNRLALAKLPHLNGQHGAIIGARRNMLSSIYLSGGLTRQQVEAVATDYDTFGDIAILKVRDGFGRVIELFPLPSLYLRRRKDNHFVILQKDKPLIYSPDDVIFIQQYDTHQQFYGIPGYLGGIHSALLNMEATIFRRRFYNNGAHMGYIFYATDPTLSTEVEEEIKVKIEKSKGVGNFRSMFINIPNGDPDGIKIIPVGDMGAKDDYNNVKNISGQDVLTSWRFPAGIAGIIPSNTGGLGDPAKARADYIEYEITPFGQVFEEAINNDKEIPEKLKVHFKNTQNVGDKDEK